LHVLYLSSSLFLTKLIFIIEKKNQKYGVQDIPNTFGTEGVTPTNPQPPTL
jgi:hypothetical protein